MTETQTLIDSIASRIHTAGQGWQLRTRGATFHQTWPNKVSEPFPDDLNRQVIALLPKVQRSRREAATTMRSAAPEFAEEVARNLIRSAEEAAAAADAVPGLLATLNAPQPTERRLFGLLPPAKPKWNTLTAGEREAVIQALTIIRTQHEADLLERLDEATTETA
ncbi:hypothetical protein ACWGJ9_11880 [Curtobacterium citreum]